jgi:hypothetical protein
MFVTTVAKMIQIAAEKKMKVSEETVLLLEQLQSAWMLNFDPKFRKLDKELELLTLRRSGLKENFRTEEEYLETIFEQHVMNELSSQMFTPANVLGYKCKTIANDENSPFIFYLSGAHLFNDGITFDSMIDTRRKHLDAYNTVELSH